MIRPTKHLDLDTCILNVSAHALSILRTCLQMGVLRARRRDIRLIMVM
jgi:hypothetical protein